MATPKPKLPVLPPPPPPQPSLGINFAPQMATQTGAAPITAATASLPAASPASSVPNPSTAVPEGAAANPFITGFNSATPQPGGFGTYPGGTPNPAAPSQASVMVDPSINLVGATAPPGVQEAAERYRQMGPEASVADRQAAMQDYKNELLASKVSTREEQMADFRNRMEDTGRINAMLRSRGEDPFKIGDAFLPHTRNEDARLDRRIAGPMEVAHLGTVEAARRQADLANREIGLLNKAISNGLEEQTFEGKMKAKLAMEERDKLMRDIGAVPGKEISREKVLENRLGALMAQRDDAARGLQAMQQSREQPEAKPAAKEADRTVEQVLNSNKPLTWDDLRTLEKARQDKLKSDRERNKNRSRKVVG